MTIAPKTLKLALIACTALGAISAEAQTRAPFRLGVITFLSGPGSGANGMPARNAAELILDGLNRESLPAPYQSKGFGGTALEWEFIDEAGAASTVVSQFRNLVERRGFDAVIGFSSSANCLAIAPVAEALKMPTVLFDCGTPRIFEEASYRYVFRTAAHATMDNVAAARYVHEFLPPTAKIGGINQNYAWGQDSWHDFSTAFKAFRPEAQIVVSLLPRLFAGQYGAEISALSSGKPDLIHSSLWGGDLEAFILQGQVRNLFAGRRLVLTAPDNLYKLLPHLPEGSVVGQRGTHTVFAPDSALNRWFAESYQRRYGAPPLYSGYHMAQAILGMKAAYERAQQKSNGKRPEREQIIDAFAFLSYVTPSGTVHMTLGNGHQAVQATAYGTVTKANGQSTITHIKQYDAEQVNPPGGTLSRAWIEGLRH